MKRIFYFFSACILAMAYSCTSADNEFVVKGTVPQERLNGNRIFIVPCDPKSMMYTSKHFEDSIGVDSVVIENGQFEFRGKGEYLARITLDKNVRYGTQDLLIVTEPGGIVNVVIDSVSTGRGTPQNEVLQQWKDRKTAHDEVVWNQSQHRRYLEQTGDTTYAKALADSIRLFNEAFRQDMIGLAKMAGRGPAYDLLMYRYALPTDTIR